MLFEPLPGLPVLDDKKSVSFRQNNFKQLKNKLSKLEVGIGSRVDSECFARQMKCLRFYQLLPAMIFLSDASKFRFLEFVKIEEKSRK